MKLKKLFKGIPDAQIKGNKDVEITGVCSHSQRVSPGNLFIAKKGIRTDGSLYITQAVLGGAVAVLTDIYDPSLREISQVIYPEVGNIEGLVASQYYGEPSKSLYMVGITGTDGKTTTSYLIKHLLDSLSIPCGLIGTIEYIVGHMHYDPTHTTPDVTTNHKMLREMHLQGCLGCVMEVTSHALDQGRVDEIDFDVAVYTNLSSEHLDYHGTMEHYLASKNRLFRMMSDKGIAVVNRDDPNCAKIVEGCPGSMIGYSLDTPSDLMAQQVQFKGNRTEFILSYRGQTMPCHTSLVGRFNLYNTLAAIGVALSRGFKLEEVVAHIKKVRGVPGRLQRVPNALGLTIYVDYAHTDDALQKVLSALKETTKGKIITVFGCGGDRDRSKRPRMARAAEQYSYKCILTSDNPRSEDPLMICEEAAKGFISPQVIEPDRYSAIEKAIEIATPDDIILIAGKGHEKFQIFAHRTVEFDDCRVAAEVCEKIHQGKGA